RSYDGERNGNAGDGGGGNIAQEQKNDHDHERYREHEFELDVFDRSSDRGRAVCQVVHLNGGGEIALQEGKQLLNAVNHLNDVRPRLALNVDDDCGSLVHPCRLAIVFHVIVDASHVRELHRRPVVVGDDDLRETGGAEQLVVRLNLVVLLWAVEIALRLVETGLLQGGAHILEVDAIRGKRGGIYANPHSRLLPAADADESHARELRDFLREARIGEIFDLRQGHRFRRKCQGQNRRVCGIRFAINRRDRQIGR